MIQVSGDALSNLEKIGKLVRETPDQAEIEGLTNSAAGLLADAKNSSLNIESRFNLAYSAAHALARAALRAEGYRCKERYLVFQCLKHTLDLPNEKWRVLDDAHRKRNLAEYEGALETETIKPVLEALIRTVDDIAIRLAIKRS